MFLCGVLAESQSKNLSINKRIAMELVIFLVSLALWLALLPLTITFFVIKLAWREAEVMQKRLMQKLGGDGYV